MTKPTEPTQAEIDAAAERMTTPTHQQSDWEYERDKIILARAYLAQRKAESVSAERDARPITAEWLDSLDLLEREFDRRSRWWRFKKNYSLFRVRWDGEICGFVATYNDRLLRLVQAQGQLRDLCSALGCPLPESEGEA